jgi:heme/copper-type cytochrome/quinol oxidase subunit 2
MLVAARSLGQVNLGESLRLHRLRRFRYMPDPWSQASAARQPREIAAIPRLSALAVCRSAGATNCVATALELWFEKPGSAPPASRARSLPAARPSAAGHTSTGISRRCKAAGLGRPFVEGAKTAMQVLSRLIGVAAGALAVLMGGSAAFAQIMGQPHPKQVGFQAAATPVMEDIVGFHDALLIIITLITAFVLALLLICMVRFNRRRNPTPSRTTHNTLVEVIWTVVPIMILTGIAIPSFKLLFFQQNIPPADLTIKAQGNQWYWSYSYPDNGKFEFDSRMLDETDRPKQKPNEPRLLAVDNDIVVPINKVVRAGDRRRVGGDPLVRGAFVRHQDRRRARPAQRNLVQGRARGHLLRAVLGTVRARPRLHADRGACGERRRVRQVGGGREEEIRARG